MCGESCIKDLLQFLLLILILLVTTPLLGRYMARVFSGESLPGERLIYKILRIDPSEEMDWKDYFLNLFVFNLIGLVVLFFFCFSFKTCYLSIRRGLRAFRGILLSTLLSALLPTPTGRLTREKIRQVIYPKCWGLPFRISSLLPLA